MSLTLDSDTVVFDDELSPAQQRNLEKILGRTAIDRTAVILDIFAQNARSQEGKAQVELALLRYRLPRLRGQGLGLSQQAGGIGTRGPGETQLEVDRRRLVRRMTRLEADLKAVSATRRTQSRSAPAVAPAGGEPRRATPTPASRRCSTASPTPACSSRTGCSRRSTPAPGDWRCPGARRSCCRTRSGSSASSRISSSRPSGPPSRWSRTPISSCTWWTRSAPEPDTADRGGAFGARRDRRRRRARAARDQQGRSGPGRAAARLANAHEGAVVVSALTGAGRRGVVAGHGRPVAGRRPRGGARRPLRPWRRPGRGAPRRAKSSTSPTAKAPPWSTSCSTTPAGPGSGSSRRRERARHRAAGFSPPPYPYDRLADAARRPPPRIPAASSTCPWARPATRRPHAVVEALATSGTERGYPASIGSAALRGAAAGVAAAALLGVARGGAAGRVRRAPRSSWPARRGTCGCAPRAETPCWPRPSRTRPMPWGRGWPGAGWWRCPPAPTAVSIWRPSGRRRRGAPCAYG